MRPAGMTCLILGGDQREIVTAEVWSSRGWHVIIQGLPDCEPRNNITYLSNIEDVLPEIDLTLLPVRGMDDQGIIHHLPGVREIQWQSVWLQRMKPGARIVIGTAPEVLRKDCKENGIPLHELMTRDDFAFHNAIPTAEGAILSALQRSERTLHGCAALVIGYGRTGIVLAQKLHAWSARVTVAARKASQRAHAETMGCSSLPIAELRRHWGEFDFIFNTVPAMMMRAEDLSLCRRDVVITDVASAPGGVDFQAAHHLGISIRHELSLPGRTAPKSAGTAIVRAIDAILTEAADSCSQAGRGGLQR